MAQYVIGIDLGTRAARAVIAVKGFRDLEIKSFHEVPVTDEDAYPLAALLEEVRRPGATYAVRLPGDRVALRLLSLPFTDNRSIEQVAPAEIEAALPFDLDDIVYDLHIALKTDDGSKVLAVAARSTDVASFLEPLAALKVDPRVLDAEPIGLGALADLEPELREGTVALVDAGQQRTGVVVLKDGRVVFCRTLASGAAAIERALTEHGIDAARAPIMVQAGVVEHSSDPADAVAYRAARGLAMEVGRTLAAFSRSELITIDRVVLMGGLALVPGFARLMETTVRLPTHIFELTNTDIAASNIPAAAVPRAGAALALMARAAGERSAVDVNLRKDAFAYHRDSQELGGLVYRFVAVMALLLVLAGVDYTVKVYSLRSERHVVRIQIAAKVAPVIPSASPARLRGDTDFAMSVLTAEVTKLRDQVKTLQGTGASGLEMLREVSARIPADITVDVTRFDFNSGQLKLEGTTDSFASIDKIVESLREGGTFFKEVEVINRGSQADKKTFRIVAKTAG